MEHFIRGRLDIEPERIAAMLSVTYGKYIPAKIAKAFRHAERCWKAGDRILAQMHLALTGTEAVDRDMAQRLFACDWGMNRGITPDQLFKMTGILRKDDEDDDDSEEDDGGDSEDDSADAEDGSDFDSKHPRWPGGTPGGIGGEFAPKDEGDAAVHESSGNGSSHTVVSHNPQPSEQEDPDGSDNSQDDKDNNPLLPPQETVMAERDCYAECAHLLPSPSGDLQGSEYRKCYRECTGSL